MNVTSSGALDYNLGPAEEMKGFSDVLCELVDLCRMTYKAEGHTDLPFPSNILTKAACDTMRFTLTARFVVKAPILYPYISHHGGWHRA